jgi:IS1 family transposase
MYNKSQRLLMSNHLKAEKVATIVNMLVEGMSVRSAERMTGVHRDTILRHLVTVGQGCARLLDARMRDLPCERLELDELWAFVGKKQRHVKETDDTNRFGDAWTYVAIDAETKLVPAFTTGKRDESTTKAFIQDLASRLKKRVQITTDGLKLYVSPIAEAFGTNVDYANLVKQFEAETTIGPGKYSPPKVTGTTKTPIFGQPIAELVSTSYVERNNLNIRMNNRRFTRLTNAHSKKLENHGHHLALHFAYYNFARIHGSLRVTPAMAAGLTDHVWSLPELLEAAENVGKLPV